jgi:hypothetical protein
MVDDVLLTEIAVCPEGGAGGVPTRGTRKPSASK